MYINVTSSLSDNENDEDDVPAFAYYIIGFGLGLLIAIVILVAVCIFCCNIRDRWYDKSECVSIRHLTHAILGLSSCYYRQIQYAHLIYQ